MAIEKELLDRLLADYNCKKPEELIGENGLLKQLTKAILERALQAEMTVHLGHEKNSAITSQSGNVRNGKSGKTIKGEFGKLPIEIPRDRDSSFEPVIIPKGQTRFAGFDDKIISLYSRGMTTREIQGHLEDIYGVDVSPTLISTVIPMPLPTRSKSGRIARWMPFIPLSTWTPSGLRFAIADML